MGSNGTPRSRGSAHYLHKQWVATKSGETQHRASVLGDSKRSVVALTRKGGKRVR